MISLISSWWTLGGIGAAILAIGGLMLTPLGAPVLVTFRVFAETKLGRIVIAAVGAVVALVLAMSMARQKGRDEERLSAATRDAAAVSKADQIDTDVAVLPEDKARDELKGWGPK